MKYYKPLESYNLNRDTDFLPVLTGSYYLLNNTTGFYIVIIERSWQHKLPEYTS